MIRISRWALWWRGQKQAQAWILRPCDQPLFSERYGYHKPVLKMFGYRLFVREKNTKPITLTSTEVRLLYRALMYAPCEVNELMTRSDLSTRLQTLYPEIVKNTKAF